jgi:hypothetical protein
MLLEQRKSNPTNRSALDLIAKCRLLARPCCLSGLQPPAGQTAASDQEELLISPNSP